MDGRSRIVKEEEWENRRKKDWKRKGEKNSKEQRKRGGNEKIVYNHDMKKKEIGILVVLGIFVVALIVFGVMTQNERNKMFKNFQDEIDDVPVSEAPLPPEGSNFIPTVPENIIETTPLIEAPAAPGSSARFGGYEIEIRRNGFIPPQIVVKKGDAVQIKLTATDGKYDFVIPYLEMSTVVNQGETKQITLRVDTAGTFAFECKDFCPITGTLRGALVVKE